MKAAVVTEWKHVEVQDVPIPEIDEGECLIKVRYAGVCGSDLHIYEGHHPAATTPVVLGHEFVGTVKEIKPQVPTDVTAGDRVVVQPLISCGVCEACQEGNWHVCRDLKILGVHTDGAFAEYVKAPVEKVIKVSDALPDRVATLTEPFAVGFHVNRRAGLRNGDTALVIGGGPIGLVVGMMAKIGGALQVVFSEIDPNRVDLIQELGFTAINPDQEDAMERIDELTDGMGFDVVFEVSGSQGGVRLAPRACRIRGTIVLVGLPAEPPRLDTTQAVFKELTMVGSRVYSLSHFRKTTKVLDDIVANDLFDVEKLISDTRSLDDLEAVLRTMKEGRNRAKILIPM